MSIPEPDLQERGQLRQPVPVIMSWKDFLTVYPEQCWRMTPKLVRMEVRMELPKNCPRCGMSVGHTIDEIVPYRFYFRCMACCQRVTPEPVFD